MQELLSPCRLCSNMTGICSKWLGRSARNGDCLNRSKALVGFAARKCFTHVASSSISRRSRAPLARVQQDVSVFGAWRHVCAAEPLDVAADDPREKDQDGGRGKG